MNTAKLVQALVVAAERKGAKNLPGVEVKRLVVESGKVVGVETNMGRVSAGMVVLSAGAWVGDLLKPLGVDLGITPERTQSVELGKTDVQFSPCVYGPLAIKLYKFAHALPSYRDELVTHPLERANPGVEFLEGISQRRETDASCWDGRVTSRASTTAPP